MEKNQIAFFLIDNKEATVNAINTIKKIIKTTLGQVEQLKLGKLDDNNAFELCQNTIKNVYLLIDTIDKKRKHSNI